MKRENIEFNASGDIADLPLPKQPAWFRKIDRPPPHYP
jgi:hypothetical protein